MKARAYLDLTERKANGEPVKGDDIKKHKNDILRLSQLLVETSLVDVPSIVKADILTFINVLEDDNRILSQLKIEGLTIDDIKRTLLVVFCS